jgi:hypothetical protein
MELMTFAKSIKITAAQTSTWTFDDGGKLTLPADSSILTSETALNIATHSTETYTFNEAYWAALNGNNTRIFTPTGNAQYFYCTVTANQSGAYTVNITGTGNGFIPGNWFKIPGNELGGTTPANDIQITIATVDGGGGILTTTVTGTAVSKQWQFGTDGTTTLPGALVKSTVAKTGGGVDTETAIDLTKSINKLTDGLYTLADGVEGQIMYLVKQTGTVFDAVTVIVENARTGGILYTNLEHYPFSYNTSSIDIDTLIFTDGAWQAVGGEWD